MATTLILQQIRWGTDVAKRSNQAAFYDFSGGINYRDAHGSVNELRDGENFYWTGSDLRKRAGSRRRNASLDISGVYASGDVLAIQDHIHVKYGTVDNYFLFVSVDSGGGSTADKLVVFYGTGVPDATNESFTALGSAYAISWTDSDPISVAALEDKVYMALGDDNPYVLYYDSGWKTQELPLCTRDNADSNDGANIVDNDSTGHDWDGCKWFTSYGQFLYLSDGKTIYFSLADVSGDPSEDIDSATLADRIAGVSANWDTSWRMLGQRNTEMDGAVAYKDYLFAWSETAIWSFYNGFWDQNPNRYERSEISTKGVHGELLVTPRYLFWIGEDNIYGYDGVNGIPLGKKIWDHIADKHSTLPDNLANCSWAYYDDKAWVSFPGQSSANEVWIFDPDLIYAILDESYIPAFKLTYRDNTTDQSFVKLRNYEGSLMALSTATGSKKILWQLDTGDDDGGTSTDKTIKCNFKHTYFDADLPGKKKVWGDTTIEVNDFTDYISAVTCQWTRDYGAESDSYTGLDVKIGTGSSGRTYVPLQTPYQVDGQAVSYEMSFNQSSDPSSEGDIIFYGYTLEWDALDVTGKEE